MCLLKEENIMTTLTAAWSIGGSSGSKTELQQGEEICKTPTYDDMPILVLKSPTLDPTRM